MSSNPLRLRRLFDKYVRNGCSPEELQEFWMLMQEYADNDLLDEDMASWWNAALQDDPSETVDGARLFQEVLEKEKNFQEALKAGKDNRIDEHRLRKYKWVAAAAVAGLLGIGIYFGFQQFAQPAPELARTPVTHDVQAPQSNRAVITLANGQFLYLDSSENGTLTQQGNVRVVKLDGGKVTYNKGGNALHGSESGPVEYNTLTNPRGSKVVNIILADGSRIWLNAGSSLRYPVVFSGNERRVYLSGEAYFEVIHNERKPFQVKAGSELIEDVGTVFNVRAYTDEPGEKTTLVEGAVKVTLLHAKSPGVSSARSVLLRPGDQATVEVLSSGEQQIRVEQDVNVDDAIAWKEGRFRFSSVDIATIMREVARWYDVDVIYKGTVEGTMSGGISRTVNISGLLHVLALTGKVHFTVEGKKVTVQPTGSK